MKFVFILCVLLIICATTEGWRRRRFRFRVRVRRWFGRRGGGGSGSGSVCSRVCTANYKPVCGSDGKTYSNDCYFRIAKCKLWKSSSKRITIKYRWKCRKNTDACSRRCPSYYRPVCGSDVNTYRNKCFFRTAKCKIWKSSSKRIRVKYRGKCRKNTGGCLTRCPANYNPMCGSDGKTYGNNCHFGIARCKLWKSSLKRITVKYRGKCRTSTGTCPKVCPKIYRPVCGSNGMTYGNKCAFQLAKCRIAKMSKSARKWSKKMTIRYSGKCKVKSKKKGKVCRRKCYSKKRRPVCGSNGVLYSNMCYLRVAKCLQKKYKKSLKTLRRVSLSKCKRDSKCSRVCTRKYFPVCGSNGILYRNSCFFNKVKCGLRKFGKTIRVVNRKRCYRRKWRGLNKGCRRRCYLNYSPVCASNGKTYWNMCVFKAAQCFINNKIRKLRYGRYKRVRRSRYGGYRMFRRFRLGRYKGLRRFRLGRYKGSRRFRFGRYRSFRRFRLGRFKRFRRFRFGRYGRFRRFRLGRFKRFRRFRFGRFRRFRRYRFGRFRRFRRYRFGRYRRFRRYRYRRSRGLTYAYRGKCKRWSRKTWRWRIWRRRTWTGRSWRRRMRPVMTVKTIIHLSK